MILQSNETSGVEKEVAASNLKSEAAGVLQRQLQAVELHNSDHFLDGNSRFLYGTTDPELSTEKPRGFFKMTEKYKIQLARESQALAIAKELGITTVGIITPYTETTQGKGIIELRKFNAEDGRILASAEEIAAADPEYGARAARAIRTLSGKVIPQDVNSTLFKRGDWRNESAETFWKVWDEQNKKVFDPEHAQFVEEVIGEEKLQAIVDQTRTIAEPIIQAGKDPTTEYFVHNDTAPNNMFFPNEDSTQSAVLLDFEHAAASHNRILAQLTDMGNFYGRMWPNPDMQKRFLTTFLRETPQAEREATYKLLKTTAVFGSLYLAKYGMAKDHEEHVMSVSLLKNLEGNLASLDAEYQRLQTQAPQ